MLFFVFGADNALAQADNLATFGAETGLGTEDPRIIVAKLVRAALGTLGVIGVVLVIYGGFLWMTSQGDEPKITKAKGILINAAIGTAIILSSLAITQFIINSLAEATGLGSGVSDNAALEIISPFSASLGNGILDSHYPPRNGSGIARNTNIVVSFREAIYPGSIMSGFTGDVSQTFDVNTDAVKIYVTSRGETTALTDVDVAVTPDLKAFVFNPDELLGLSTSEVNYTVELTDQITLDNNGESGTTAFSGRFSDGYRWTFRTSTIVDNTPPKVVSVVPVRSTVNPRNILIQVNYSEAINPITASGFYPDASSAPNFVNIRAEDSDGVVSGEWKLVNQFRSSEFIPTQSCGTNSCGEAMYCLPPNETINAIIESSSLSNEPPAAVQPATGVTDMAGNAFDGDGDGDAEGPALDRYQWTFSTTGEVVIVPPEIVTVVPSISPGTPASNILFDQPVTVTFDSLMSMSSINADNLTLWSESGSLWYSFDSEMMSMTDPTDASSNINVTQTTIDHGIFSADKLYGAEIGSGVKSVFQNCFIPSHSVTCNSGTGANCCNEERSGVACAYPEYTLPTASPTGGSTP